MPLLKSKRFYLTGLCIVTSVVVALGFQNCGRNFETSSNQLLKSQAPLARDCNEDESVDACVFFKNPVAQIGSKSVLMNHMQLADHQTYGVSFEDFMPGATLQNGSFAVYRAGNTRSLERTDNDNWRHDLTDSDGVAKVGQLMSFYWANFATQNAFEVSGKIFARGKKIKIITDDAVFGWAPSKNQIHLLTTPNGDSMALDASIVIYFLGWANLEYATNGNINVMSKTLHKTCGPQNRQDCCTEKIGCSRALASGQADYFVAMTFPNKPAMGDGWSRSTQGNAVCQSSLSRHPASFNNATVDSSYSLCAAQGQAGSIYALGAMYSSIWWNVRNASGSNPLEIDRLFLLHLEKLDGDDNLITVKNKILQMDTEIFSGKYNSAFENEFTRRGIGSSLN